MYNFDDIVTGAFSIAQSEVIERKNSELDALHLLFGLISNKSSYSYNNLNNYKIKILEEIDKLPTLDREIELDSLRSTSRLQKWLALANSNSVKESRKNIIEKDLLKTLPKVLPEIEIDFNFLSISEDNDNKVPDFLINLNEVAVKGRLDPVIGRKKEIRALMEILGRRNKNNPVLVGDAGVGKTAIVEGLVGEILNNSVPDVLHGKTIYSLDLCALMSDTKFRGDFEKKIKNLIDFMKKQNGEAILFIDEIHQLVGAGKTDGAMDAANLLKPALARGELHTIGATTFDEYQKYILSDGALDRRFRPVNVYEPSLEDSIEILIGLRSKYEVHHGISITDDAIYNAVYLSDRYIKNKNLPDKAIDLLDEASSSLKLSAETLPPDLEQMGIEIKSKIIKYKFNKSKELKDEISELESSFKVDKDKWDQRVKSLRSHSALKSEKETLELELERCEREGDYENAGQIKYSLLPEIEAKLIAQDSFFKLKKEDIAQVISRQTKIPIEKILKEKQEKLLELERTLNESIYSQEEALHEISEVLLSSMAGLSNPQKPMGSFLLKGPTGVGKTETAKQLARFLFNDENNIIRIDMSEYSEKHSVSKLIGAPSGYVGYEEGGILTEAVRRKPYSIILFDEIEKAHYDFSDILLQILDDGRLSDNKGRVIDFRNTIVLLTTNSKDIKKDFKPEVLGRLDSILEYNSLDKSVMGKLVSKQLSIFNERIKDKKMKFSLGDNLVQKLINRGFSPDFGARPLANAFNLIIIRPLAKKLLKGELKPGAYILEEDKTGLVITLCS